MEKRKAFTLAEVLITLGIIGVVAAITLPLLIQNYQKMVLKNQFKKVYALMQVAMQKTEADLGYKPECYYWSSNPYGVAQCVSYKENGICAKYELQGGGSLPSDYNGRMSECTLVKNKMEKNLKIVKKCQNNAFAQNCIPAYKGVDTIYKDEHADEDLSDVDVNKAISGCSAWSEEALKTKREVWNLADGTIIIFLSGFQQFAVDVNGMKGPNKWGYDVFGFTLKSNYSLPLKFTSSGCVRTEKGGLSTEQMLKELYK